MRSRSRPRSGAGFKISGRKLYLDAGMPLASVLDVLALAGNYIIKIELTDKNEEPLMKKLDEIENPICSWLVL